MQGKGRKQGCRRRLFFYNFDYQFFEKKKNQLENYVKETTISTFFKKKVVAKVIKNSRLWQPSETKL